jgi:hypothetical protein
MASISVWPDIGDFVTRGCWNTITRKKNKIGNEDFGIVSMVMTQEDTDASRVL